MNVFYKLWRLVISEENLLKLISGGSVNHGKNTHEAIPSKQIVYTRNFTKRGAWVYGKGWVICWTLFCWDHHGGWTFNGGHDNTPGNTFLLMQQLMNNTTRRGVGKFI